MTHNNRSKQKLSLLVICHLNQSINMKFGEEWDIANNPFKEKQDISHWYNLEEFHDTGKHLWKNWNHYQEEYDSHPAMQEYEKVLWTIYSGFLDANTKYADRESFFPWTARSMMKKFNKLLKKYKLKELSGAAINDFVDQNIKEYPDGQYFYGNLKRILRERLRRHYIQKQEQEESNFADQVKRGSQKKYGPGFRVPGQ